MNQTTLNVIAITIFTVVMASLLGPLIHLSPLVPAIAIFGMLSIATVDALGFQGQGGTLFIDWLSSFSAEHRDRVVHHEAGHFLVACLLGIPVTGYTLTAWDAFRQGQPGRGGVSFSTQELDSTLERGEIPAQLLDRYCRVWMAGIAAEMLVYGNAEGGADDRQKFGILWAQLRRPDVEGEQKAKWAAFQAKTLIQNHWSAYEALVTAMQQQLPVAECSEIIDRQISATETA